MKRFMIIAKRGPNNATCFLTTESELPTEQNLMDCQYYINRKSNIREGSMDKYIVIDFKEIAND